LSHSVSQAIARVLKASCLYFALVFGAGFLLGSVRVPFLVPRLGARAAELVEMPLMFFVVIVSARFVVKRFGLNLSVGQCLWVGMCALALLIGVELSLALAIQGQSPVQNIAERDPVSGSVYILMLCLFAAMPSIIAR
jgi:hypothetical protein